MKIVEIELRPCKVCNAKYSQIIHKSDQNVEKPWSIYCNACGRNDAEFSGKSKAEVVMKWNADYPDKTVPLLKAQYLTEGYDPKLIKEK